MPLPAQDMKESYTPDEVQHLIAREWAKNEILQLRNGHMELQRQMIEVTGATNAELKSLRETLIAFPNTVASQIAQCRRDLREEIEQDFPSKLEAISMEKRIEDKIGDTDKTLGKQISDLDKKVDGINDKVERQWLKITVVVGTIVAVGGFAQWFFATGKHLVGG